MSFETRRESRRPITLRVSVRVNPAFSETVQLAKESIEGRLADISIIGIGLISSVFLPPGVLIDIELPRPALADPNASGPAKPAEGPMPITGKVVYARPFGSQCRIGVSFTHIEEADRLLIQEYVSRDRRNAPRPS